MSKRPNGMTNDFGDVILECLYLKDEHEWDKLPSQEYLKDNDFSYLVSDFRKYGGLNIIRGIMGEEVLQRPKGCFDDLDDVISECNMIKSKNEWGVLPSSKYLNDDGFSYLANAIGKHKWSVVRDALGENIIQMPDGWADNLKDLLVEYNQLKNEHGWDVLPSEKYLRDNGFGYLASAIIKHSRFVVHEALGDKGHMPFNWSDILYLSIALIK